MAAERPTKLTKEASDELIAEAKDELAELREKAKGRRLPKEEIDPFIADLRAINHGERGEPRKDPRRGFSFSCTRRFNPARNS
jgi:hypothetical protein